MFKLFFVIIFNFYNLFDTWMAKPVRMIFIISLLYSALWADKPSLLLLKEYREHNVTGWLMSEKLDGVRAYWDGTNLLSRGGKAFAVPKWFIKDFPPFAIDGELWTKRNDFETVQSIVSRKKPHDGWKKITYNIFEVPYQKGGLTNRLQVLEGYLAKHRSSFIKIIPQIMCESNEHLKTVLSEIETKGGEGLVVRDPDASYINKRTSKALKVKSFQDAECEVIAIHKGKGKYRDMMGSFRCKGDGDLMFKVGSGLKDAQRQNPFAIGTIITYKHQGFTQKGKPRFPVFLRTRDKK